MKMAQGDPYSPSEITGDAEPTMIRPKAHSDDDQEGDGGSGAEPRDPARPPGPGAVLGGRADGWAGADGVEGGGPVGRRHHAE